MAIKLVKFSQLNAILGLEKQESDYPDLVVIKASVTAMFESYTRRKFEEDKYTENVFTGPSLTKMIPLKALPIKSVSSVLIDGVEATGFKIKQYGIELLSSVDDVKVDVIYIGGIDEVPGNINRAALLQTIYEYQNKTSIGLEIVSNGGGSITKPELGMLKEVKSLLKPEIHPFPVF